MNELIVSIDYIRSLDLYNPEKISQDVEIFKDVTKIIASSWISDRTEIAITPFRTFLKEDYKLKRDSFQTSTLSLEEVCQLTVDQLIDKNKKIYVLWSGGLDSTLILISMLKSSINKSSVIVACNPDCIKENFYFYKNYVLPNFEVLSSEKLIQLSRTTGLVDSIVINGDPADVLYGIDINFDIAQEYGADYLCRPCSRESIVNYFVKRGMTDQSANCWFDFFNSSNHFSPKPMKTIDDFFWWCAFNYRWQSANEKLKLRLGTGIVHDTFFGNKMFQNWAAGRNNTAITSYKEFKKETKDLIFDYTKDTDYYQRKIKIHSNSFAFGSNSFSAILKNEMYLKIKDFNIYDFYTSNNFINDWLSINN